MIRMIAACTSNGVIGLSSNNSIPFNYPADMQHFKKMTTDSIVIMGRKTFESIGKPLPKRRNIVISKIANDLGTLDNNSIEVFKSIDEALYDINLLNPTIVPSKTFIKTIKDPDLDIKDVPVSDIWFIGGASIYQESMKYAEEIHLTITPDIINDKDVIRFPWINPNKFYLYQNETLSGDDKLNYIIYRRKS